MIETIAVIATPETHAEYRKRIARAIQQTADCLRKPESPQQPLAVLPPHIFRNLVPPNTDRSLASTANRANIDHPNLNLKYIRNVWGLKVCTSVTCHNRIWCRDFNACRNMLARAKFLLCTRTNPLEDGPAYLRRPSSDPLELNRLNPAFVAAIASSMHNNKISSRLRTHLRVRVLVSIVCSDFFN